MKGEKSFANSSISIVNTRQPKQSAALYVQVDELTVTELKAAERWWIASAQGDCYSDTIQHAATSSVPRTDPLFRLNPRLNADETPLLVVGGRLKSAAHLPEALRSPIILPSHHCVTELILNQEDEKYGHVSGAHHILANLRQAYWILNGVSTVRRYRQACLQCKKHWKPLAEQIMGPLPDIRTNAPDQQAFSHTAVDYAGPFLTRQG